MKKMKSAFLLTCGMIIALSFSSCLNSSDDSDNNYSTLTTAQRALYHTAIKGYYNGYLYWYDADNTNQKDSIAMSWAISSSDSTITLQEFHVSILADFISNTTAKEVLETVPDQEVTMTYYIPTTELTQYIDEGYYRYGAYPTDNEMEFTYNGNNFIINFGSTYSNGYYTYYPMAAIYSGTYAQNIIIQSLEVNGTSYTVKNGFLWLIGTKEY